MKPIRQAIVLVDAYRRPSRRRNTAGRYRVGAKTEKEAEALVRKAIGFGSVKFYYWEDSQAANKVGYREVVREVLVGQKLMHEPPRHACDPVE